MLLLAGTISMPQVVVQKQAKLQKTEKNRMRLVKNGKSIYICIRF